MLASMDLFPRLASVPVSPSLENISTTGPPSDEGMGQIPHRFFPFFSLPDSVTTTEMVYDCHIIDQ